MNDSDILLAYARGLLTTQKHYKLATRDDAEKAVEEIIQNISDKLDDLDQDPEKGPGFDVLSELARENAPLEYLDNKNGDSGE